MEFPQKKSNQFQNVYQLCIEAGWKKKEHKTQIEKFIALGESSKYNLDLISPRKQSEEFEKMPMYVKTNIYIVGCEVKWRDYGGDQEAREFAEWLYHVSSPAIMELYLESKQ